MGDNQLGPETAQVHQRRGQGGEKGRVRQLEKERRKHQTRLHDDNDDLKDRAVEHA